LAAGQLYDIKLEYYERSGGAVAQLLWSSPTMSRSVIPRGRLYSGASQADSGSGNGLHADYYDNIDFTGLAGTRVDNRVDFDWGGQAPFAGMDQDSFSVRWTGVVEAPTSGVYTFSTLSDDGVRLWVDGLLLINNWSDHAPAENSGSIVLAGGQRYDIRVDYYERTGGAIMRLLWSSASTPKGIVPRDRLYAAQ
jgi:hypothetical protein